MPNRPTGSITDPKVRRKLREAGPPDVRAAVIIEAMAATVTDTPHLVDAMEFWRWFLAERLPRSKPLAAPDWELTMAMAIPAIAALFDRLDEVVADTIAILMEADDAK